MTAISSTTPADLREVARRIHGWLESKGFEVRGLQAGEGFVIKARKASTLRAIVGADRALEIGVQPRGALVDVEIRQGSWKTNAVSNAVWLVATGGMNLAISGWSLVIQKDLEHYVRSIFEELGGAREVDLH